ncbi:MAG: hypothetical protein RMJ59_04715 [Candidatus Nitrosocaldus sp.]|nr:hypothetical protein [Candidatus Nitrosocaldus sp.]MDW8275667.1 hypothetical protein [Candidatus Nitrosocaldus sp.]
MLDTHAGEKVMNSIKPIDIALKGYGKRMYYVRNRKDIGEG